MVITLWIRKDSDSSLRHQKFPRIKIFLANGDLGGVCVREIHTLRPKSSTGEKSDVGGFNMKDGLTPPSKFGVKACAQSENHGNSGQLYATKTTAWRALRQAMNGDDSVGFRNSARSQ